MTRPSPQYIGEKIRVLLEYMAKSDEEAHGRRTQVIAGYFIDQYDEKSVMKQLHDDDHAVLAVWLMEVWSAIDEEAASTWADMFTETLAKINQRKREQAKEIFGNG